MRREEDESALAQQLEVGLRDLDAMKERKAELEERLREMEIALAKKSAEKEISEQVALRAQQLEERAHRNLERVEDRLDRAMLMHQDGAKSLALLNSAAAAAMLAFAQALAATKWLLPLKPFVVGSLVCFLAGALIASSMSIPLARVMVSMMERASGVKTSISSRRAEFMVTWIPRASTFAFFAGASGMVAALWLRL